MNKYFKIHIKIYIPLILICILFNLYFIYLIPQAPSFYIYYLDFLIIICLLLFFIIDYYSFHKKEKKINQLLQYQHLIYSEIHPLDNSEIIEHDIKIMQAQLNEQYQMNCDLQDYIAKWCHEVKLPLSALLLMNEKVADYSLKTSIKEQLEKIRQQLNDALIGCKVQSHIYDLQIQEVNLNECITTSIKNNQYFLIQKHFEINIEPCFETVYTDKEWLVYVLDQIIANSIKYCQENPQLHIKFKKSQKTLKLSIEDHGIGILESDIRNIFKKGFTGRNQHNGKYKSTGMGLYFVDMILQKLGHDIVVESEYGKYTRFIITFQDNRDYFQR